MFHGWDNFFFMIGSAAASLIGLLFVVITLTTGIERSRAMRGTVLYMTPTAVHFGVVLTMSAVALAPRLPTVTTALVFGLAILVGLANAVRASVGIRKGLPGAPAPHWSDFWFYGAGPAMIYLGLGCADVAVWTGAAWATQAIAAALMVLLLVGIRNAWDLITWMAPLGKPPDGA